ncbi:MULTISPECIES: hypothetical protein [Sphingomonadales]|jgi:branched-chain amino acid transport system substrate-binding protein|uniref:ABC transporter substrate-binding protein n=1 Tax=Rhizorhabdus wittichii TaxID=160791 RepID=A0A975D8E7_9SPHN|nr:hypothetical protein [Rhizorhabdus wittichii]QTH24857.1 hypothetical protein HRJ34_27685 [Rhizorhabdus wittichii]QUM74435.1 hypothetical protein ICN83_20060 [Sphingopyxis granuli]
MLKLRNPMKCLMATAVVCVSVLLPAAAQTKPPLKIGAYLSVTGPASYLGAVP